MFMINKFGQVKWQRMAIFMLAANVLSDGGECLSYSTQ